MKQRVSMATFINNNGPNYCELSHLLLEILDKSILVEIDLSNCDNYDFVFKEIVEHFCVWFPRRIEVINY